MSKLWSLALVQTPSPHTAIFRIDDFSHKLHAALLKNSGRCIGFGQSVCDDALDFRVGPRCLNEHGSHRCRISLSFEFREGEVSYLDSLFFCRCTFECARSDDLFCAAVDRQVPKPSRITSDSGHELYRLSNHVKEDAGILTDMGTVEVAELFGVSLQRSERCMTDVEKKDCSHRTLLLRRLDLD